MGLVDQIVHLVETRAVRVGALLLTKTPLRDASATPPLSAVLSRKEENRAAGVCQDAAGARTLPCRQHAHGRLLVCRTASRQDCRALSCSLASRPLLPDRPLLTCTLGDHRTAASGQSTVCVWTVLESQTAGGSRSRCASHGAACYRRRHCQAVPRCSGMVHA